MKCLISMSQGQLVVKQVALAATVTFDKGHASLASLVNHFLHNDKQAKGASANAEAADAVFPSLPKRIRTILTHEGFDAKLIRCTGYRKKVDDGAAERVRTATPSTLDHAVVLVNAISIDPCRLRMGDNYDLPPTYNKSELPKYWVAQQDVTKLATMMPEGVRELIQSHKDDQRKEGLENEVRIRKGTQA